MRILNPHRGLVLDGLIGWWPLNEGSGTVANDASGYGHPATLQNVDAGDWVAGKFGNYAVDFDGSAEYGTIPSGSTPTLASQAAGTLCAWINLDTVSAQQCMIAENTSTIAYTRMGLFVNSSGNVLLIYRDSSQDPTGSATTVTGLTALSTATWYHVAAVFDSVGEYQAVYLNGAVDNSSGSVVSAFGASATAGVFFAANTTTGNLLNGRLDDVRMYNRRLSTTEIAAIYGGQG